MMVMVVMMSLPLSYLLQVLLKGNEGLLGSGEVSGLHGILGSVPITGESFTGRLP